MAANSVDVIIYHSDCPDGWCAALIAKKRYPDAELMPATHGHQPPFLACEGKDVLIVDFSWKRQDMLDLEAVCKSLLVIDHHKTAEAELAGLPFCVFDMNRSGAGLTWDYLFHGQTRPWYVNYVEDRDLWRWALPDSREVSAYLMALPMTEKAWRELEFTNAVLAKESGKAVLGHIDQYIAKIVAQKRVGTFHGHGAAIVNAAYPNISDVCNVLCEGHEIGIGWFQRGDGMIQFSLRSKGDLDVSALAKTYGGGGHKNAAGFQLNMMAGIGLIRSIGDPPWDDRK